MLRGGPPVTADDVIVGNNYINPDTLRLKLRLTITSNSLFHVFLDEVHLRTTYS